jgi:hypothetical protein
MSFGAARRFHQSIAIREAAFSARPNHPEVFTFAILLSRQECDCDSTSKRLGEVKGTGEAAGHRNADPVTPVSDEVLSQRLKSGSTP